MDLILKKRNQISGGDQMETLKNKIAEDDIEYVSGKDRLLNINLVPLKWILINVKSPKMLEILLMNKNPNIMDMIYVYYSPTKKDVALQILLHHNKIDPSSLLYLIDEFNQPDSRGLEVFHEEVGVLGLGDQGESEDQIDQMVDKEIVEFIKWVTQIFVTITKRYPSVDDIRRISRVWDAMFSVEDKQMFTYKKRKM